MVKEKTIFLKTDRLVLRQWGDGDRFSFAQMNCDPDVMKYFPRPLTSVESDALLDKFAARINNNGFGIFAVEERGSKVFVGFIGLSSPSFEMRITPCTEIAWRLHKRFWGEGYATEGAGKVLEFAFDFLGLGEVVSFASRINQRSINVMERIGMKHDPADDFDHPVIKPDDPLCRHVLYRKKRSG